MIIVVALEYKTIFGRLKLLETPYRCLSSEEDWELTQMLVNNLKPLYDVTQIFSGTKYSTSNIFFVHSYEIRLALDERS